MRFVIILLSLAVLPAIVAAQTPPDIAKAMADIEAKSIASFPVGAWVKVTDAKGLELTISVKQKIQGKDGWQVTTEVAQPAGSKEKPASITTVMGSTANVTNAAPIVKVGDEDVTVGGKAIKCKVFTYGNGQRKWMSPEIPGGGSVKVVGPKGEPFLTLVAHGKP